MASLFSILPTAIEAVTALSNLAFGATGGVVLDKFAFSGFEVPEYITVGGSQCMTVHKLPGGERVIDVLGDDPADIAWSGTMIDRDPESRARTLTQMRAKGAPVALHFGQSYYTVVVHTFEARLLYGRVQYSIACTVLRNEATAPRAALAALTDVVGADVAQALTSVPAMLASAASTAQAAVAALGTLIPGSPRLAQAAASLGAISGQLGSLTSTAGSAIVAVSSASSLASVTAAAGQVAQSLQSAAYIGRAVRNLT